MIKKQELEEELSDGFELLEIDEKECQQIQEDYESTISFKMNDFSNYQIENWYPQLQKYTYKTEFIALDQQDIDFLISISENMKNQKFKLKESQKKSEIISNLASQIQKALENLNLSAFLRLNTRSPKDVGYDYQSQDDRMKMAIQDTIIHLQQQMNISRELLLKRKENQKSQLDNDLELLTKREINEIFQFIQNYGKKFLKVTNAEQALTVLCQSDRIYEDLTNITITNKRNQSESERQLQCLLCVRQWEDFSWQDEFRCFFYDKKLTAICQYEEDTYSPELNQPEVQQKIIQTISNKFNEMKELIPMSKGVIDFIMSKNYNNCNLLEINPFQEHAGTQTRGSLFSWQEDQKILQKGPLEFRVLKEVKDNVGSFCLRYYGTPSKTGAYEVIKEAVQQIWKNNIQ